MTWRFARAAALAAALAAVATGGGAAQAPAPATAAPFDLEEATIADLQRRMESGQETARSLVQKYLARIEAIDRNGPALHSVIETNPDALEIADRLDAERKARGPRGPLHGIPVLVKDNIATGDRMLTTAGSLALAARPAPRDAFVAAKLREAGAIILGKTNLSEWANFRSTHASSGWSGRGGQTKNPYALDRSPSGSSSGSGAAAAASLCAAAVGTETDGSVVSPASNQSLVGIKPTLGLVSRTGIVPISHTQDTAGPMARTVADAAALLTAMAGRDPDDEATTRKPVAVAARGAARAPGSASSRGAGSASSRGADSTSSRGAGLSGPPSDRIDYTTFLELGGLKGARIGVVRNRLFGYSPAADRAAESAIAVLQREGATIVDPANIPTLGKFDDTEFDVLLYEFKADLNKYLAWLGPSAPVHSLEEIIAFNEAHKAEELPYFGQELMLMAQKKGPLTDPKYRAAVSKDRQLAATMGIDAVMTKYKLDALVAPTNGPAWLIDLVNGDGGTGSAASPSTVAAVAGYPHITVPAGYYRGLPIGLSFIGRAWSEPTLIRLAYGYEQATKHRRPPRFAQSADLVDR